MAEVKTEQEPSIEEILESIRQIISEDTEDPAAKQAAQTLEAVKEPAAPPSNLSLTPKAEAPVPPSNLSLSPAPAAAPAAPAASPTAAPAPVKSEAPKPVEKKPAPLDLTEKVAPAVSEPSPITIEMMDSPMTDNNKAADSDKAPGSLMSAETAAVVTDSLAKILASNVAIEAEKSGAIGKVTLEDIARELMKPLIKTWIDQNLPGLVDKAVQREVEKLSRRVMDR